jgi:DNA-binding NtrC family response regulator
MSNVTLLGRSQVFVKALSLIAKLAKLSAPVLIEGETGTGKELAARAIHYGGERRNLPFVPVNCGTFPDTLIESELFGYMKGAFTDARADTLGLVSAAEGGTLFLDEVDALSPRAQVAVLRFLQDGSFRPVGSRIERKADVRIIAASNASLDELAASGSFRLDLLYRLKILSLRLPPLRERDDDAMLLAREFLERCKTEFRCAVRQLDEDTCDWFYRYRWPGNIRELEGLIYREAMICDENTLRLRPPKCYCSERRHGKDRRDQVFDGISYSSAKSLIIEQFDRRYLVSLMEQTRGNVSQAARLAGKERRAFGKLLKKHGLDTSRFTQN